MNHDSKETHYTGTVYETPPRNSPLIKVYIPNLYPSATTGKFQPATQENTISILDKDNKRQSVSTNTTNYVEAVWKGRSNIPYPPSVVRGERVSITHNADTDKYFWESEGKDQQLRTTDVYRIEVSATELFNQKKNDDNTYSLEFNSKDKYIRLRLSKANGEKCAFICEFNGAEGIVILSDDKGGNSGPNNRIMINSPNDIIQLNNNQKSSVLLTGENIIHQCNGNFTIKAGKQIILESPSTTLNSTKLGNTAININADNIHVNTNNDLVFGGKGKIGINNPVKSTKSFVANDMRAYKIVQGDVKDSYNGIGIDLSDGTQHRQSNSLDADTQGDGNRHACAFEQALAAIKAIDEYASSLGAIHKKGPLNASSIMANAKMNKLKSE